MNSFYNQQTAIIENNKLVLVSNGGSRELIGIQAARKQLAELEGKVPLRESTIERLNLLRSGIALWEAQ